MDPDQATSKVPKKRWGELTWILDSVRQLADAKMRLAREAVLSGAIASSTR